MRQDLKIVVDSIAVQFKLFKKRLRDIWSLYLRVCYIFQMHLLPIPDTHVLACNSWGNGNNPVLQENLQHWFDSRINNC
jgi:hypothetical protein